MKIKIKASSDSIYYTFYKNELTIKSHTEDYTKHVPFEIDTHTLRNTTFFEDLDLLTSKYEKSLEEAKAAYIAID